MPPETDAGEYIPGLFDIDEEDELDVDAFEPMHGSVPREVDVGEDEHPIRQALGPAEHREFTAHEGTVGERFAFRYDRVEAVVREYLANSETACLNAARFLLHQHDPDTYDREWFEAADNEELLAEAREVVGYQPVIETHHAEPGANRDRFVIEDNGIGISVREFEALRQLGLSANHGVGEQLGDFGQGVMSVFNAIGRYGEGVLETWSRVDDANYRMRMRIDGFNDLSGKRDEYGTTWRFPAFSEEAQNTDIDAAIEEFTQAMHVPVIHHTYDGDGVEQAKEEYTPQSLADLVDAETGAITYEDDYVEAVTAPEIDTEGFLISMPIDLNDKGDLRQAPFPYKVRLKREDGAIYECTCEDVDHEGLIPVEDERFERECIESREAIHPAQLKPTDVVGYVVDEHPGAYVVPRGVDDELVEASDELVYPEQIEVEAPLAEHYPDPIEGAESRVVAGTNEGRALVSEEEWHNVETEATDTYVPYSELELPSEEMLRTLDLPEEFDEVDVPMPTPVDDRDRLESHSGAFLELVSARLNEAFIEFVADVAIDFSTDGFDAWFDLDEGDRELFAEGLDMLTDSVKPDRTGVRHALQSEADVLLDGRVCEQLARLFEEVEHAPRDSYSPNRKKGRTDKQIADVLLEAGDGDVYMGATVNADKAELAWELGDDTQVVAVEGSHIYDTYARLFGWKPLKELSLHNIAETYDGVNPAVAERLERSDSGVTSGGGVEMDELDAASREIKIRSAQQKRYKSTTAEEIESAFEDGDTVLRDDDGVVEHLLVFRETEVGGVGFGADACLGPVSRTVVPNYVADYLDDIEHCHVVEGREYDDVLPRIFADIGERTVETFPIDPFVEEIRDELEPVDDVDNDDYPETTEVPVTDLGEETLVFVPSDEMTSLVTGTEFIDWDDTHRAVCEGLVDDGCLTPEHDRMVICDPQPVEQSLPHWELVDTVNPYPAPDEYPTVVKHNDRNWVCPVAWESWKPSRSVELDMLFPKELFPRDTPEWGALIKKHRYDIKRGNKKGKTLVRLFYRLADVTPDDEPIFPSQV